jgi:hypothetical protein
MAKATMEFKRGAGLTHTFSIPLDAWSAGGTLFFAAKPAPDDDSSDTAAVIDRGFDDTYTSDVTINGVAYKKYTLPFVVGDISSSVSFADGSKKQNYLGDFKFVPLSGEPMIFPGDDSFIEVIIYANIKVGNS